LVTGVINGFALRSRSYELPEGTLRSSKSSDTVDHTRHPDDPGEGAAVVRARNHRRVLPVFEREFGRRPVRSFGTPWMQREVRARNYPCAHSRFKDRRVQSVFGVRRRDRPLFSSVKETL